MFRVLRVRRLRYLPRTWWICAIAIALSAGLFTAHAVQSAHSAATRLGGMTSIYIATHDLDLGTTITSADIASASWPRALLPSAPLAEMPIGTHTAMRIIAGEPIVATKLAPAGLSTVAALLRPGQQSIDIPHDSQGPNVSIGDAVDVIAASPDKPARVVASSAHVIAISDSETTIAVTSAEITDVVEGLEGRIALSVVGPEQTSQG